MKFDLSDALTFTKPRRTADGYLVADVRTARTGIQIYRGSDIGLMDRETVSVYRPEEEVFSPDSMGTFAHKPVTDNHPPELVTAKNWKKYAVGKTGGEIARDGEFIAIPLSVMDEATIQAIEAGKRELSAGYTCDIDFTPGVTEDGQTYDAIQRNIRINHVAVVDKGRAGQNCRIGDTKKKETQKMDTQTVIVDGFSVETTKQGAEAIAKLQKQLDDSAGALNTAKMEHATTLADKDKELAQKDAEIDKLKQSQVSDAELDKMVADRASVIAAAKKLDDSIETSGKSNADIRRAAVAKKLGDTVVADKSDDYISARFDALVDAEPDSVRKALMGDGATNQPKLGDADAAYAEMNKRMGDAWKMEGAN